MRSLIKTGILVLALTALPVAAEAGTMEGAAIGAGSGLLIADSRRSRRRRDRRGGRWPGPAAALSPSQLLDQPVRPAPLQLALSNQCLSLRTGAARRRSGNRRPNVMRKMILAAFMLTVAAPLPAIAYTQADIEACTPDAMRLCQHAFPSETAWSSVSSKTNVSSTPPAPWRSIARAPWLRRASVPPWPSRPDNERDCPEASALRLQPEKRLCPSD